MSDYFNKVGLFSGALPTGSTTPATNNNQGATQPAGLGFGTTTPQTAAFDQFVPQFNLASGSNRPASPTPRNDRPASEGGTNPTSGRPSGAATLLRDAIAATAYSKKNF